MQDYDVALKALLRGAASLTIRELTGDSVETWLDVELPRVQNPRADLLGETAGGSLVHLELQSTNDATMALRMAEYSLGVFRLFGRFPRQVLLYVGEAPLRMDCELRGDDLWFRYRAVDIRDMDGERLSESEDVGDNVIAILTRLRNEGEAVRKVVCKIAALEAGERELALAQLMILAGIRHLEDTIKQEVRKMPIDLDIRENKFFKEQYDRGRQEADFALVRRLIEARFGALPAWAEQRLTGRPAAELEELGVRVLSAQSLEELLR